MKKTFLTLSLIGLTTLFTACQNTVNTVENEDKSMVQTIVKDKRVITDGSLEGRLLIENVSVATTEAGLLRVQLWAKNNRTGFFSETWSSIFGGNPYKIKYKFTWFDAKGMALESIVSQWTQIEILPGETAFIQSIAPAQNAKDFLVNIVEAE